MKQTLTSIILTAASKVHPTYSMPGSRKRKATQGEYLSGLLGSYADAVSDIGDDTAYLIMSSKRTMPMPIVRYYVDSVSLCPAILYDDIAEYYSTLPLKDIQQLYTNLCDVLPYIPKMDCEIMLHATTACNSQMHTACTLLTMMLYYAWRTDLCQYEYL